MDMIKRLILLINIWIIKLLMHRMEIIRLLVVEREMELFLMIRNYHQNYRYLVLYSSM